MRLKTGLRGWGLALALMIGGSPTLAEEVVVFAAASLKTALDQIAADYQAATGNPVTISYGGSNMLARQIIEGAPADIFLSASEDWMQAVEEAGITEGSPRDLLDNRLVLIAHGQGAAPVTVDAKLDLPARLQGGKLAVAMVDAVPAGQYAKEALQRLGLWSAVAGSLAEAENVRAALALVATGEAPLGIVYATDAHPEDNVTVIGTFPADSHRPIVYPLALLTNAQDPADRAFFAALQSDQAKAIFRQQGFDILK